MSDTPETDANQISIGHIHDRECWWVDADFARKLERERNEARARVKLLEQENAQNNAASVTFDLCCCIAERDQLRKVADAMAEQYRYEMMSMFGHASDCDCSRCEPMTKLYNSLPHVIERTKSK